MKDAADAFLKPEQADYLDALQRVGDKFVASLERAPGGGEPARDAILERMEARAAERRYPISDPEVAAFLAITVRAARPRFLVELGTNIGYGAIVLARAAGPDARVLTVEYRQDLCDEARGFIAEAGLSDRIEVRQGMAIPELEKLERPIDFAYVDCVKEEYPRYLELIVPRLSERGVIVADNVLWKGHVARPIVPDAERERTAALRAFNLAIMQQPALRAVVLPLGDGVAYAVRA